jgi:hypothetical protein
MRSDSRRTLVLRIRAPKRIGYAFGVVGLTPSTDYGWVEGLVGGRLGMRKEESIEVEFGTLNQSWEHVHRRQNSAFRGTNTYCILRARAEGIREGYSVLMLNSPAA